MRASLDTNVLIHIYRAGLEDILFEFFTDGVFIYEQIRKVELEHHGKEILDKVDSDIESGKIKVYTDETLKQQAVLRIFETNVNENKLLYGSGDLGEIYAISLAQTIGAYSLVTDDMSFRSQIVKFIKRFWKDPYKNEEKKWMSKLSRSGKYELRVTLQSRKNYYKCAVDI